MFGATAVRRKREKERRERAARNSANTIYPYIKPFGERKLFQRLLKFFFVLQDQDLTNMNFPTINTEDTLDMMM